MEVFDPSKFNTAPVTVKKPQIAPAVFNPATAMAQVKEQSEKEMREKLTALDPNALEMPEQLGPIKAWSFSALKSFEECRYRAYLKSVKKVREESSVAAERGNQVHDIAENFVRGTGDFSPILRKFKSDFESLKSRVERQTPALPMSMEENWGFTTSWAQTGWTAPDTWVRQKLDVFYKDSDTSAVVIDHKTGRKFGNELKHGEQGLHYAIGAFKKYPELDYVQPEFSYIDQGEKLRKNYTRDRALIHLPKIQKRAIIMTTAVEFIPNPTKRNCKWCYYAQSGDCEYAETE